MASPGDSMLEMKKRKRMQVMQKAAAEAKKKEEAIKKQTQTTGINLAQCDLGASPQMRPVSKGGLKYSPLSLAREL